MSANLIREVADDYFAEGGVAEILLDEFSSRPEFIRGQERGHWDAHAVLHGVADWLEDQGNG